MPEDRDFLRCLSGSLCLRLGRSADCAVAEVSGLCGRASCFWVGRGRPWLSSLQQASPVFRLVWFVSRVALSEFVNYVLAKILVMDFWSLDGKTFGNICKGIVV